VEAAQPQLILDRGIALIIGRVAGVKCGLYQAASSIWEAFAIPTDQFALNEVTRRLPCEQPDESDKTWIRVR
jgi:hypothetical protein